MDMRNDPSTPNDADWATLPPELVDKILSHSLAGVVLHIFTAELFPWHLGQICRSWRSVFVSSPLFWNRFTVIVPEWNMPFAIWHMERSLALIQLCIKRTEGRPFSFKFEMPRWTSMSATRLATLSLYAHQSLQTLVESADRWRDVYITANREEMLELAKAKHRFEHLRTLKLQLYDAHSLGDKSISAIFEHAPNLERAFVPHYFRLPWSWITTLHLYLPSRYADSYAELSQMTRLEELVISGPLGPIESTAIKMPFLKILSVDFYPTLSLIDAPALEELYVNTGIDSTKDPFVSHGPTFLRRVNHLKCATLELPPNDVLEILECITDLDELILSGASSLAALQQLISSPMVHCLGRVTVSHDYHRLDYLLTVITSWNAHQIMNLRSLSIYVYGGDTISPAVSTLMKDRSAELGFEITIDTMRQKTFWCYLPFGDL